MRLPAGTRRSGPGAVLRCTRARGRAPGPGRVAAAPGTFRRRRRAPRAGAGPSPRVVHPRPLAVPRRARARDPRAHGGLPRRLPASRSAHGRRAPSSATTSCFFRAPPRPPAPARPAPLHEPDGGGAADRARPARADEPRPPRGRRRDPLHRLLPVPRDRREHAPPKREAWLVGLATFGLFVSVVVLEYAAGAAALPRGRTRDSRHRDAPFLASSRSRSSSRSSARSRSPPRS